MKISEIRKQYPQYDILSDGELATALHQKFYPNLEFKDFSKRIGYLKGADPSEYDSESSEYQAKYGPTSGMSGPERIIAGAQQGLANLGRGIRQRVVETGAMQMREGGDRAIAEERAKVADSAALDKPLLDTAGGKWGSIGGTVAATAPAMFLPGANTVAGAGVIGGALGFLSPSQSHGETLKNVGVGGALGSGSILAGRGVAAAARGGKALLWDPFTQAGQDRIAARTFQAFAGGPEKAREAAAAIRAANDVLPGVQPTTAEVAGNAGLAQLERTLKNNPEFTTAFADRAASNRNAMLGAIDSIAGDDAARAAAVAARKGASGAAYAEADKTLIQPDAEFAKLMNRPSMKAAVEKAKELAAESGDDLSLDGPLSGKTLHYVKQALDDLLGDPQASGITGNVARAVGDTRAAFLKWFEGKAPSYGVGRERFAELSRPINQMDIGQALRDKLTPAITDFGANTRIRPESFAQAMRQGDVTASRALERPAKMADVMSEDQMKALRQVGEQLARRVNADELGRAVGSNTGQNIVGQNVLRQILGPMGLPQSWVERGAGNSLAQGLFGLPAKVAGNLSEPQILKRLVQIGLTPNEAAKILDQATPAQLSGLLRGQGLFAPAVVSGTNAARQ